MPGANAGLIESLLQVERERGIDKESIFWAIEEGLLLAYKKNFGSSENIKILVDRETGEFKAYEKKTIVEEVLDKKIEISLEEAKEISKEYQIGDIVETKIELAMKDFARVAAQAAKQKVLEKIREADRNKVFADFAGKENQIMTGIIQRVERARSGGQLVYILLGKTEFLLVPNEQIPGEEYGVHQRLKVVIMGVKTGAKGQPELEISRSSPEFIKALMAQEIPEISDGTIEIKSISREAGFRTKVAVASNDENVEAIGVCVGASGSRVNILVEEISSEKIDIIKYSDDASEYISASLAPAGVTHVLFLNGPKEATAIVPDAHLSLAIGRMGQNVRLAAKLTGFKIDIKGYTVAIEEGLIKEEIPAEEVLETEEIQESQESDEAAEIIDSEYDDEYEYEYEYEYEEDEEYEQA